MKRLLAIFCTVFILACAMPAMALIYGDFDWRIYAGDANHVAGNYVTSIRNQGSCGSCWAFGSVAALESQFRLNANNPNMTIDLSEQHLLCDGSAGSCDGGDASIACRYFVSDGITDEATLPYRASNTSPLWPLEEPYTLYKTTSVNTSVSNDNTTSGIKIALESTGPLAASIYSGDFFTPTAAAGEAAAAYTMDFSTPDWFQDGVDGLDGGTNHVICIVGYKDDASVDGGGYWIVKNSWGSGWGDHGYGFLEYGDIEQYGKVRAITGNTYTVTIDETNYAPVAVEDSYTTYMDQVLTVDDITEGVLANDTDPNAGDDLDVYYCHPTSTGVVDMNMEDGTFTFTPREGFVGDTWFWYRTVDEEGLRSEYAIARISVLAPGESNPSDVPEPGTCTLLIVAMTCLLSRRRCGPAA